MEFLFRNNDYLYPLVKTDAKVAELSKYTKELRKLFSASGNILIVCHINPDGDAIGSQLALYHYLKAIGKEVDMISPNNLQEFLKWMDGADHIKVFIKQRGLCKRVIEKADLIVMVDFNQPDRLGEAEAAVKLSSAKKVIIDHHRDPFAFADLIISETSRCATSEIIYDLLEGLNPDILKIKPVAEALYIGIITDTGNFDHGTYSGHTFRITADLLETGIDKEKINQLVYNNFTADRMRLLGYALKEKMVVLPEYQTAFICLTREDLSSFNYIKGDTEGFVNMPLSIKGVVFSALFIEKDNYIKISFRSKGNFPVNEFASEYFSGGGHMNASGGEYPGSLDKTISYFQKVLKENFERFNKNS